MLKNSKVITLCFLAFLNIFLLSSFVEDKNIHLNKNDVREIVWEQLSKGEQNEIIDGWENAKIEKIMAKKDSTQFLLKDETLDGKEVYLVTFESRYEPFVGNVQKLVDIKSNKIVGTAHRD